MTFAFSSAITRIAQQATPARQAVRFAAHSDHQQPLATFGKGFNPQANPFVLLLNAWDNGMEQLKQTRPGKFLNQGFSKVDRWLKASPEKPAGSKPKPPVASPAKPEGKASSETGDQSSFDMEKVKAFLRKINPTIQGQNPFVSLLNGLDTLGDRFAETQGGKWVCQRLKTVDNWLKDSSVKTEAPASSKKKTPAIQIPSIPEIRKKAESHSKSPLLLELDHKSLQAVLDDLAQSNATCQALQAERKIFAEKDRDWAAAIFNHEAAIQVAEEKILKQKLTSGDRFNHLRDRQKKAFESLDEATQSRAINQANLQDVENELARLAVRIDQLNQLKITQRQTSAKPVRRTAR